MMRYRVKTPSKVLDVRQVASSRITIAPNAFFCGGAGGASYVAQAHLKLMILLPQSPECLDYKGVPQPCPPL
jgi:hypothetical protein